MKKLVSLIVLGAALSGCTTADRLSRIGKAPDMSAVAVVAAPEIEPSLAAPADRGYPGQASRNRATASAVSGMPGAAPSASLFRTGAGAFFRDQRASQKGDILTIRINITDRADLGNSTTHSRGGSESGGISSLLGLEKPLAKLLPGDVDTSNLVETDSKSQFSGSGQIARSENINMTVAAIVTDVLPNGNLVVRGRQEVRVNFELRELIVTGIVRPEDIARDNSIAHSKIAEARIIYGGKGQLSDAQQQRWGQQIYDALFPF